MSQQRPLPEITAEDAEFWRAAKEHRLVLPRCRDCGLVWFPPYARCTRCASSGIEWIAASGRGRIWGWIEMHRPYIPWFAPALPYNVVLVRLDEGAFMYSNVVGARYEDLRADLPVEVVFEDVDGTVALPKFRLVDAAGGE
ncbi:MAG: Zn-ribbon domain-containing OB-fold protein [Gammaproteobacteria bacterium]